MSSIIEKFADFNPVNESKKESSDKCSKMHDKLCKKLESFGKCKIECKDKKGGKIVCDISITSTEKLSLEHSSNMFRAIKQCCGADSLVKSSFGSGKKFEMTIECNC